MWAWWGCYDIPCAAPRARKKTMLKKNIARAHAPSSVATPLVWVCDDRYGQDGMRLVAMSQERREAHMKKID